MQVNIPEATIVNEERKKDDLERKKDNLEKQIMAETNLLISSPRILGSVIVISEELADSEVHRDPEVEKAGMEVAARFEKQEGRTPENVSKQNLGFDIRSRESEEKVRYIEVKARAGTGSIVLTPNEWLMANRLGEQYWLYIVENAKSSPALWSLKDPASKIKPSQKIEIVRYIVDDWKAASNRESMPA